MGLTNETPMGQPNKTTTDVEKEVIKTKQARKDLDEVLQRVKGFIPSRECSIAITNLQQSIMWLGMNLKALNTPNPYPESYNPQNTIVEKTADGLKL